ncbi:MAG: phenylalanine--tRNA ligase subunit beta [Eubacteriales bacterium]|nr:phenylalanine--tRNA ligase subunit beta [Eubacteriales bacterium]
MKISYNWLKEILGFDLSSQELANGLAAAGFPVESIAPLAPEITGVVVAELLEVKAHPNADRLSLTKVCDGAAIYDVVCGAHNIAQGDKVPLAKIGAVLPGNFKIKKSKIRGEVSEGMLCSADELQLDLVQDSDGILQLPKNAEIGRDINAYLALDDLILDVELTANRGDLLSLRGLTTEIGAFLGKPFSLEGPKAAESGDWGFPVSIETDSCSFYTGRLIKGVQVGPSPLWLQLRLLACGMRPVNNIVDIANLVMLEWGQPLHAFDADKLPGHEITVRQARAGETMITLDNKEHQLEPSMMLITSGGRPVTIAGVMGSLDSEVDANTTNIFLESAVFDAISVRLTAKALGISSEAGSRFEKGVDPAATVIASQRAANLIRELAGGEIGAITSAGTDRTAAWSISVSVAKINGLLGADIPREQAVSFLANLGLKVEGDGDNLMVHVPGRRQDLLSWQDIAEEVGRLYGFDQIPVSLPEGALTLGMRKKSQSLEWQVRELLAGCGLHEVMPYSFISPEMAEKSWEESGVEISNPLTREASIMRSSMLPSLLETVAYNFTHGQDSVAIFEVGNVFKPEPDSSLPSQVLRVAGALAGREPRHWQQPAVSYDFFALKGVVQQLLLGLGIEAEIRQEPHRQLHPGRCAAAFAGNICLGHFGQVHPAIVAEWKLDAEIWVFDLDFLALAKNTRQIVQFIPPSRYPAIRRDLALETSEDIAAGTLMALIREAGGELLEEVECFDVYTGGNLEPGGKSLAFSLSFRHPERTLQDKEVQGLVDKIIGRLEEGGARLRS